MRSDPETVVDVGNLECTVSKLWVPAIGEVVERCLDDVAEIWMRAQVVSVSQCSPSDAIPADTYDVEYCDDGALEKGVPLDELRSFRRPAGANLAFQLHFSSESWNPDGTHGALAVFLQAIDLARMETAFPSLARSGCTRDERLWERCGLADFGARCWERASREEIGDGRTGSHQLYRRLATQDCSRQAPARQRLHQEEDREDVVSWRLRNGAPAGYALQSMRQFDLFQGSSTGIGMNPLVASAHLYTEASKWHVRTFADAPS